MVGHKATVAGVICQNNDGPQIKDVDILSINGESTGYTDPSDPVTLDASAIDGLAGQIGAGLLDITYFTATGSLIDPYHNLVVDGTETTLAFYGNDSKKFDLDAYCDYCNKGSEKKTITVKGYYISRQKDDDGKNSRINFIVTDIQPELPEDGQ